MNNNDAIRRVSLVSNGIVQIHPEHIAGMWQPTWFELRTSVSGNLA